MQDIVVVTGVSGFVASHVAVNLLRHGYRVRGTVRDPGKGAVALESIRTAAGRDEIDLVAADLTRDDGWAEAMRGARYVIHCASPLPMNDPEDEDDLIRPARDGSVRVLRAAAQAGVERVVVTSSIAAMMGGHRAERGPVEPHWWTDLEAPDVNAYAKSKTIAERAVWELAKAEPNAPQIATINPGAVIGPVIIPRLGTSNRIVEQIVGAAVPAVPRVGFELVDVRDVAEAHRAAMVTRGAAGKRLPATAGFMWLRDVALILADRYPERRIPTREMPDWLVRLAARFVPTVRAVVADLGVRTDVRSTLTMETLGWHPRPLVESVVEAAGSLIEHDLVGHG